MAAFRNEFLAVVQHVDGLYQAACPEMPDSAGKGQTKLMALDALRDSVERILETRRELAIQHLPEKAVIDMIIL